MADVAAQRDAAGRLPQAQARRLQGLGDRAGGQHHPARTQRVLDRRIGTVDAAQPGAGDDIALQQRRLEARIGTGMYTIGPVYHEAALFGGQQALPIPEHRAVLLIRKRPAIPDQLKRLATLRRQFRHGDHRNGVCRR